MKRLLAVAFSVLMAAPAAYADSWSYPRKVESEKFVFGITRVVLTMDARKNPKYPDFLLEIFKDWTSPGPVSVPAPRSCSGSALSTDDRIRPPSCIVTGPCIRRLAARMVRGICETFDVKETA